jgi:hypothetical protein
VRETPIDHLLGKLMSAGSQQRLGAASYPDQIVRNALYMLHVVSNLVCCRFAALEKEVAPQVALEGRGSEP